MDAVAYYRRSLALPLVAPVLAFPLLLVLDSSVFAAVLGPVVVSLAYGGAPYLVLALLLLRWMRGRSESQICRASWLAPFLMIPLEMIALSVYSLAVGEPPFDFVNWMGALAYFEGWVAVVGYGYVVVVNGVLAIAKWRRWVSTSAAA